DQLTTFKTEQEILGALREAAKELREWIAADWVRWTIHQGLKRPSGQISTTDPLDSLRAYGERVREEAHRVAAVADLEERYAKRVAEVERFLGSDKWLQRLPGKQLLQRFLGKHTKFTATD